MVQVRFKPKGKKMGRMQRNKGARGERELARELVRVLGVDAGSIYRSVQHCGREGAGDVLGVPGVHIESKRTESLSVYKAMEQALDDCGRDIPIVCHKRNLQQWLVICELRDLVKLSRAIVAIVDSVEKDA